MHKKLMMAYMAIAAFAALVVAPAASATNLTENGVTISSGASVKATNVGNTLFSAGELTTTCTAATFSGTIVKDSGGQIIAEVQAGNPSFTGTGTSGDCTSPLGNVKLTVNSKLCLEFASVDSGQFNGCSGFLTITLNVTNIVTCTYDRLELTGFITTGATGDAAFSPGGGLSRDSGGFFCPNSGTLTMTVDLTTTNGTTLAFSA